MCGESLYHLRRVRRLLAWTHELLCKDARYRCPRRRRHVRPDSSTGETVIQMQDVGSAPIPLVETLGVGIHAVGRAAAQTGDRAIVIGAGPIGLSVIEFLRLAGADIGIVEKMPERLDFAVRHHSLCRYYPSHEEARQEEPSMLVFDCTGDKGSMEGAIQLLQQGGTLIFVGLVNDTIALFDPDSTGARLRFWQAATAPPPNTEACYIKWRTGLSM